MYAERDQLILKRNEILSKTFFWNKKKRKREIEHLDKKLDKMEMEMLNKIRSKENSLNARCDLAEYIADVKSQLDCL